MGFEVDENGLLKIAGFDDNLNSEFTRRLPELFKKAYEKFKNTPKIDTSSYIKTFQIMHFQHYKKYFKN